MTELNENRRQEKNRRKRHKTLPLVWTTQSIWNTNQQEVNFRLMLNVNDLGYFYSIYSMINALSFVKYTLQICITKRVYFTRSPPLTFHFMTTSINHNEVIPLLVIILILLHFRNAYVRPWLLCTANHHSSMFNKIITIIIIEVDPFQDSINFS